MPKALKILAIFYFPWSGYARTLWPPFALYLGVYLGAVFLDLHPQTLKAIFWSAHLTHLLGAGVWLVHRRSDFLPSERGATALPSLEARFWIVLALGLLVPGAYLEFPGDGWEHFRRIFSWQAENSLATAEMRNRFAYFFSWTLIGDVSIPGRRLGLGLVSAFWQLLVLAQLSRFFSALGFAPPLRRLLVVGWLAYFGTSVFGLRYYALSATPLAMFALFAALTSVQNYLGSRRVADLQGLAWLVLLMELNHPRQESCLFIFGTALLTGAAYWKTLGENTRRRAALSLYTLAVLALLWGVGVHFWGSSKYAAMKAKYSLPWWGGVWPFAESPLRLFSTWGIPGLVGLLVAPFTRKISLPFTLLCSVPSLLFLLPPSCFVLLRNLPPSAMYRVLYLMPAGLLVVLFLYSRLISPRQSDRSRSAFVVCLVWLAVSGFSFWPPVYGRLFLQFYSPPRDLSLEPQDETAQWFAQNRPQLVGTRRCKILTDDATHFALVTQLALPPRGLDRLVQHRELIALAKRVNPYLFFKEFHPCGVLIPKPKGLPLAASLIGNVSGHWSSEGYDFSRASSEQTEWNLSQMLLSNWTITHVPPYYEYWEPQKRD